MVQDWKFLHNKINNEIMTGEEFYTLSKKIAVILKNHGLEMNDVVHLMIGNCNMTFGILGGIWYIGGICSLSDTITDVEVIKEQVNIIQYPSYNASFMKDLFEILNSNFLPKCLNPFQ